MELSAELLSALQEMSIAGMRQAAVALSQLMKRDIQLDVPRTIPMDVAALTEFIGGRQQMVVGLYLQILGDVRGNVMMIFTREDAMRLLDVLFPRQEGRGPLLTELEASALKEVGNILASSYLNALGEKFGITLIPSVPHMTTDMAGVVMDYMGEELGVQEGSVMVETEFSDGDSRFKGHFFLLPVLDSFTPLLVNGPKGSS